MFRQKKRDSMSTIHEEVDPDTSPNIEPTRAFSSPVRRTTLADLIEEQHPSVPFEWATLRPVSESTVASMKSNLAARITRTVSTLLPMRQGPVVNLKGQNHVFSFKACIDTMARDKTILKRAPWVRLSQAFIIFDGSADYYSEQSTVRFVVRDNRYLRSLATYETLANSSGRTAYRLEMGNSIHYSDLGSLVLEVENTNNLFDENVFWGSMQIDVAFTVSDKAESSSIIPMKGLIAVDPSLLEMPKRDPRSLDMRWAENERKSLKTMWKNKMLLDLSLPPNKQPKSQGYAGSVAGSSISQEDGSTSVSRWVEQIEPAEVPSTSQLVSSHGQLADIVEEEGPAEKEEEVNIVSSPSRPILRSAFRNAGKPKSNVTFST